MPKISSNFSIGSNALLDIDSFSFALLAPCGHPAIFSDVCWHRVWRNNKADRGLKAIEALEFNEIFSQYKVDIVSTTRWRETGRSPVVNHTPLAESMSPRPASIPILEGMSDKMNLHVCIYSCVRELHQCLISC